MFGRHKKEWKVSLLIEGEKGARQVSRLEQLDGVNPMFDMYPIDVDLPQRHTLRRATQIALEYAKAGIYSVIYRGRKKPLSAEKR